MGLHAGAGVAAGQAAGPERKADTQAGATGPAAWIDKSAKVITPAIEVTSVEARAAGRHRTVAAGPDEDRGQDRPAADPVDAADAAHEAARMSRRGPGAGGQRHPGPREGAGLAPASSEGIRTAATTRSKTRGPGSSSTRMTEPTMTPGSVPAMRPGPGGRRSGPAASTGTAHREWRPRCTAGWSA